MDNLEHIEEELLRLQKMLSEADTDGESLRDARSLLKRVSAEFATKRQRMCRLFSAVGALWIEMAPDGTILQVNDAVQETLGFRSDELVGKNWRDLLQPGGERGQVGHFLRPFQSNGAGQGVQQEIEVRRRDGTGCMLEVTSLDEYGPDKTLELVSVFARDVTERYTAQEQLRFQAHLLDSVHESIIATDLDGHVLYWGMGAERLYGYTADEILGRQITFVAEEAKESEEMSRLAHALEFGIWEGEYRQRRKDGSTFWGHTIISPMYSESDRPVGFIGTDRDITERVEAELWIQASEQRYRLLLESTGEGIFGMDKDGRCTFFNRAAEELLGWPPEEVIGANMFEVIAHGYIIAERIREECEVFRAAIAGRPTRGMRDVFRTRDGGEIPVEYAAYPIVDGGSSNGAMLVFANIEDRLRIEEERTKLIHDLGERVKELSALHKTAALLQRPDLPTRALVRELAELLPAAMQFPEQCAVRIVLGEAHWTTQGFRETPWAITRAFRTRTDLAGSIMVVYLEDCSAAEESPFSREEGEMISSIAEMLREHCESRQAIEAVREQELQMRQILDGLPVGVWISDADGNLLSANEEAKRLWGESILVAADDYSRYKASWPDSGKLFEPREWPLARALADGVPIIGELHDIETFDGQTKRILDSAVPLRDSKGRVIRGVAVTQDVTPLHEAQEALRRLLRERTATLDALPAAIAMLDQSGRIRMVNEGWRKFAEANGFPDPQHGVGWHYLDVCRDAANRGCEDGEKAAQGLNALLNGEQHAFEMEYFSEAPELDQWHRLLSVALTDGGEHGAVVMHLDVSLPKQAEIALKEQNELLETILENIPVMVAFMDQRAETEWMNKEWERVLGWTLEDAQAGDLFEKLYPDEAYRERVIDFILNPPSEWREFKTRSKDGRILDTLWANVLLSDGKSIGIGQDITERKRLELQLLQSQKMEGIGRLAGGIAHDFNNLLTAVLGQVDIILDTLEPSDPVRQEIEQIRAAAERAASLTSQLLTFARRQMIEPREVDINDLVLNLHKLLVRLIGEDVELLTLPRSRQPGVRVDPGQFEQVLINLAVNARDAMPRGGKITVETDDIVVTEDYAAKHPDFEPGKYVLLSVADTGEGMSEEVLEHVFEPFFTTKETGKGTGLGLATCYGIVRQSKGQIHVYSEPGMGTVFRVYLPAVETPVTKQEAAPSEAPPPRGEETILLVEDERLVRDMLVRALSTFGYHVIDTGNGREAIEVYKERWEEIDLVLTDVVMPAMSGQELTAAIAALHSDVKILYMSGYTEDAVFNQGILPRGRHFITKPFSPRDLAYRIRKLLEEE